VVILEKLFARKVPRPSRPLLFPCPHALSLPPPRSGRRMEPRNLSEPQGKAVYGIRVSV
jgi:hypothetical protein